MKFSGYLPIYEDTSAIDYGPDRSIRLVGQNELDCSSVCEWDRNFQRCYTVLFNNLVLVVPKMGHMSKNGTFSKCKVVLVLLFAFSFFFSILLQKNLGVVRLR